MSNKHVGIADIGVYAPGKHELELRNDWFREHASLSDKFERRTGISARGISFLPEEEMAMRAIEDLQDRTGIDLTRCAGIVYTSSSQPPATNAEWKNSGLKAIGEWDELCERVGPAFGIPPAFLRHFNWVPWRKKLESWEGIVEFAVSLGISPEKMESFARAQMAVMGATVEESSAALGARLGIPPEHIRSLNAGCSGYVEGWKQIQTLLPLIRDSRDRYLLLLTADRLSKAMDYERDAHAPAMGDLATATLVTDAANKTHHPHLRFRHASLEPTEVHAIKPEAVPDGKALVGIERRKNVLHPLPDGSAGRDPERICWTLEIPEVIDITYPALLGASDRAVEETGIQKENVSYWLGLTPGRLTPAMIDALRDEGYGSTLFPLDLSGDTGHVDGSLIPRDIRMMRPRLKTGDIVAAPVLGLHAPGSTKMSQGCLIFEENGKS
jgi:3-oxoacyl-[acyl-carrier-protein] synthase III